MYSYHRPKSQASRLFSEHIEQYKQDVTRNAVVLQDISYFPDFRNSRWHHPRRHRSHIAHFLGEFILSNVCTTIMRGVLSIENLDSVILLL